MKNMENEISKEPLCPYCSHQLIFRHRMIKNDAHAVFSHIWCDHCCKTLELKFVAVDQPQIVTPGIRMN